MKDGITKLRSGYLPDSYIDIIESLSSFSDKHSIAINQLYDFVLWLKDQDETYPAVLFSYQVWGTTRRAHRDIFTDYSVELIAIILNMKKLMKKKNTFVVTVFCLERWWGIFSNSGENLILYTF